MILYHYTTFIGNHINSSRILIPNDTYSNNLSKDYPAPYPKLIFLTEDNNWEPCVQAVGDSGYYERKPSNPRDYFFEGIPCWRFSVEVPEFFPTIMYPHSGWLDMFKDAQSLGSDVSKWKWTEHSLKVKEAHMWLQDAWRLS